jgi:mannose-6-phosphate isomerase-like protein (cupin superfamily)
MLTHTGEHDSSIVKLESAHAPRGPMGERYLASGIRVSMRMWDAEQPTTESEAQINETERNYEVVGYVVSGRAMLHIEGQVVRLDAGSSYVVPRGARHYYHVLETFTAVEATSPPGQVHGRDEPYPSHPIDPDCIERL